MAKVEISVEPKSSVGWFVHLTSWDAQKNKQTKHILEREQPVEGKFKVVSKADLPAGLYELILQVYEAGNTCSATVVGEPTILLPIGAQWPLKVSVAANVSSDFDSYAFRHGGGA